MSMQPKVYLSPQEVSKDIASLAENIEYTKILLRARATTDEKSIQRYVADIVQQKWSIVQHLSQPGNYEAWKNQDNNQALMLVKYMQKGHLDKEFGPDLSLKNKISDDFLPIFNTTPAEKLLTNREKQNLKHYEQNLVPVERRDNYLAQEKEILNFYDRHLCFNKTFSHTLNSLPEFNRLPKMVQNAVETLKAHPELLNDSPAHLMINRDSKQYPGMNAEQFLSLAMDASVGNTQATQTLAKHQEMWQGLLEKKSLTQGINKIRNQYNPDLGHGKTLDI
jgi:hypothetical protein